MNRLIETSRHELVDLCCRHRVRRLELFGSGAADDSHEDSSDLDFLVEFQQLESTGYADAYFGLLEELQALFQRPVDLVMVSAIRNPYFLRGIERSRTLVYAA